MNRFCTIISVFANSFILLASHAHAQHITSEESKLRIARFFAEGSDEAHIKQRTASSRYTLAYTSSHLYAFDASDGFVIATANASQPPVVGYSRTGQFAQAEQNRHFQFLLSLLERSASQPQSSRSTIYKPTHVKESVAPLTNDSWHQYDPFNRLCPKIDSATCVSGCVANAMAQLMNFHNWPHQGTGSHTYIDSIGCKQTLTADYSAHTYDWDNILDRYEEGTYTEQQANAVARLLADCGVAVNMRYGTETSGAVPIRQPIALVRHFGYDEGIQMYYRNFFPQAEWDSIMFSELDAGRPMLVNAWSPAGGHSFTCDGYDTRGFFHVNFGNPGNDGDCFLFFTWLTPDQPKWHDVNNPEGGLNLLQAITTGIRPKTSATPSAQTHIFGFSHILPLSDTTVVVRDLCNLGWNTLPGRVALALKPAGAGRKTSVGSTPLLHVYDREFLLEELDDTTYTDTIVLRVPSDTPGGNYRVVPVYEENGQWVEARTMVGIPNYLDCHIAREASAPQAEISLTIPECATARLTASDVVFPDTVVRGKKPSYSFKVHNEGAEYSGRIYIVLNPVAPELQLDSTSIPTRHHVICQEGLSIGKNETLVRAFNNTAFHYTPNGQYHLRLMVDVDLFSDSAVVIYEDKSRTVTVVPADYATGINPLPTATGISANTEPSALYFDLTGRAIPPTLLHRHTVYLVRRGAAVTKVMR